MAETTQNEKKMPISRRTLLRSVISDTLTSFMVGEFGFNAGMIVS
jgi:hypothetical protein